MDPISEEIHSTNHKIRSYDQMSIIITNWISNKGGSNYKYSPQLSRLHNSLLMGIVDTTEKDL